jgi:hypothetical protein
MRKTTLSIGLLVAVLAAPSFAADPPVRAGGGFVPPSAKAPQKKHAPGLRFSVPYSFTNVDKKLKNAIIRCDVMAKGGPIFGGLGGGDLGVNLPQVGGNLPSSLGFGSVVIPLDGQPRSGAATIIPKPKPGASFDGATTFVCLIQVNNGFETLSPGNDPKLPNWAKSQGGSQLAVSGPIK